MYYNACLYGNLLSKGIFLLDITVYKYKCLGAKYLSKQVCLNGIVCTVVYYLQEEKVPKFVIFHTL